MKNLNFGDADSVGFFQMRVGIWNQGAYAGYPDKPELQVKWFLDQAEAVKSSGWSRASRSTTRTSSASGSPTSSAPPSSTAAATRPSSRRPTGCSHAPPQPRRGAAAAAGAAPVDPAAAAAGAAAVGNAKLPAEILAPVQEAIAAGNAPGPEGAGGDPGGLEVHRHRLQVGRLDAADRLRLLRA